MSKKKRLWYYVSYYEEYPIFEPAEGGYYYPGNSLQLHYRVGSLKHARRLLRKLVKEAVEYHQPYDIVEKDYARKTSDYIGKEKELRIETFLGMRECGYVTYQ